ncbi:dentin sialophosphoprotein-like protein [Lates japonicus]|uniref:Dentin sialophosphoprotein-like protein n=1 Tax=Lates japonicus TaxID=270547 RepID=A0AAD3NQI5_LATJO|nr:dentin sialophosphoprotein-like protein [Lates japonicus]
MIHSKLNEFRAQNELNLNLNLNQLFDKHPTIRHLPESRTMDQVQQTQDLFLSSGLRVPEEPGLKTFMISVHTPPLHVFSGSSHQSSTAVIRGRSRLPQTVMKIFRSDDISKSNDINHDVISEGVTRPMALILSAELETSSQPMTEENTDHMISTGDQHLSSGEMMTDEETDDFNNTSSSVDSWSQKQTLSDDFDYFNNTSAETDVHQTLTVFDESDDFNNNTKIMEICSQQTITVDYSDDINNTGSDDFSNKMTAPTSPLSDESDDFNNSTVSREMNDQPVRTVFDSSNPNPNPDLQGITLNPDNLSTRNNQQGALGVETVDEPVLDPVSQEVMSSNSEKMSSGIQDRTSSNRGSISEGFRSGSRLQEVFHSIHEVVDLFSGKQRVTGLKGSHHKVLGSTPFTGSQIGFLLNSDQSSEFLITDPKESTISSTLQGTRSRDSTQQVSGPTTSWSRRSSRSLARVDSSSSSDSSEEGQDSGGATLGLGSDSRDSSPEVSSRSEEVLLGLKSSSSPPLVTSPIPSPQTPTKSGSLWSDSNESDLSGSGSESDSPGVDPRNNSQSPDLNPNQVLISDSNLGPESTLNPNRKQPYHFGFLNPISRFYSSQPRILAKQQHQFEKPQHRHYRNVYLSPVHRHQTVSRHSNRKQMKSPQLLREQQNLENQENQEDLENQENLENQEDLENQENG